MKYCLITGAANGLGKKMAETLSKYNFTVFACDYDKDALEKINKKNIIPIYVDVTNQKTIDEAFVNVAKHTIYLDVIINCAGVGLMSSLIEEDIDKVKRVMDINLFGMERINKSFFPLLNKETGRIVNISSECGWMSPAPFNGPYQMSKFAVEAYNDTLRRELQIIGIKVIKIQPGSFKTNMHKDTVANFKRLVDSTKYFKASLKKMGTMLRRELKNANDPKYLMDAVIKACTSDKPKICYKVKNSPAMVIISMLPEKLIDKVYKMM